MCYNSKHMPPEVTRFYFPLLSYKCYRYLQFLDITLSYYFSFHFEDRRMFEEWMSYLDKEDPPGSFTYKVLTKTLIAAFWMCSWKENATEPTELHCIKWKILLNFNFITFWAWWFKCSPNKTGSNSPSPWAITKQVKWNNSFSVQEYFKHFCIFILNLCNSAEK